VRYGGDVRKAASNSLMVVDAAGTPSLIAAAKANAEPEVQAALASLQQRFERNPTR
jgi:hypothetical protein